MLNASILQLRLTILFMKKMSKAVEEQPIISGELLSNQGLWVLLSDKAENLGIFDHKFQISGSLDFSFDDSQYTLYLIKEVIL